jgi:orotidine-5'-phosphate decarboxylase
MHNRQALYEVICRKQSFLCVGLDPDEAHIPAQYGTGVEAVERFCLDIVDRTHTFAVAFKPNLAFFETYGALGWSALERIIKAIPSDCLVIADAKRGDVGNTASRYAEAFFTHLGADAVTVAPYMGADSVLPFTAFKDKWTVLLALTSNPGADDFEFHGTPPLFERVIERAQSWGTPDELMFVVGATRPEMLGRVRCLAPDHFFLVPGVGAQGGTVAEVAEAGWNDQCGLLINSSRGILYAANPATAARTIQQEMAVILAANA